MENCKESKCVVYYVRGMCVYQDSSPGFLGAPSTTLTVRYLADVKHRKGTDSKPSRVEDLQADSVRTCL